MVMKQTDKFVIPAHGKLVLKPGSNHIMFMTLTKPLKAGDTVQVTVLGTGGFSQKLMFPVRPFQGANESYHSSGTSASTPMSGMNHSGMSGSGH